MICCLRIIQLTAVPLHKALHCTPLAMFLFFRLIYYVEPMNIRVSLAVAGYFPLAAVTAKL